MDRKDYLQAQHGGDDYGLDPRPVR